MSEPAYPVIGPCTPWITGSDVASCCDVGDCDTPALLDTVAEEASLALFEISGRRFNGICERTVRPCSDRCGCWGGYSINGPWYWTYNYWLPVWGWWNECGDKCGCSPLERIPLAGYPVQAITEVLIDGDVVDPSSYRLDNRRDLVRMDDPGPPYVKRYWPSCQNLALEADQPGTFQITYTWGIAPPQVALSAASELACLMWRSCSSGDCDLPDGVTRVTRAGITIDRTMLGHWLDPSQPTGLFSLDMFLRSYGNVIGQRTTAIYSPDIRQYGLRVT